MIGPGVAHDRDVDDFAVRERRRAPVGHADRDAVQPGLHTLVGRPGERQSGRVLLIGVPQTFPPKPVNGIMVGDFLTPDVKSDYTFPADFKNEIAKVVGFTSLTFGLGAMVLGSAVLVMEPEVLPWFGQHLPRWALQLSATSSMKTSRRWWPTPRSAMTRP